MHGQTWMGPLIVYRAPQMNLKLVLADRTGRRGRGGQGDNASPSRTGTAANARRAGLLLLGFITLQVAIVIITVAIAIILYILPGAHPAEDLSHRLEIEVGP